MSRPPFASIAFAIVAMASTASTQERFTHAVGGKGGKQFVLRCPAGATLTGVVALAGAYVNNIAPICDGRQMPGAGGAGDRTAVTCPAGSVVRRMAVVSLRSENQLLKALTLHCFAKAGGRKTAEVPLETPGRYTGFYPVGMADCGNRNGIGLQGRSGVSVDAVGLICG